MTTLENQRFKFWKENKLDQEYNLTLSEIMGKYKEYLSKKDKSWVEYYGHQTVNAFVGDAIGLNSVTDIENYEMLQDGLMSTRHQFLKS